MRIGVLALPLLFAVGSAFAAEGPHHWSYSGHEGPGHWGDLSKDFSTCKLGKAQSPINIRTASVKKEALAPLTPSYRLSPAEVENNGHTIQINLTEGGSASLSKGDYRLVQFHFHTPSEERLNGKTYPLSAHLVHRNEAGNLAVVTVLLKQGAENAALKRVFDQLPQVGNHQALTDGFDATTLLPQSLTYYAFTGSLTTPPCSEGVAWHVLKQPVEISAEQIASFKRLFKMNARPVQPLHGRTVGISG